VNPGGPNCSAHIGISWVFRPMPIARIKPLGDEVAARIVALTLDDPPGRLPLGKQAVVPSSMKSQIEVPAQRRCEALLGSGGPEDRNACLMRDGLHFLIHYFLSLLRRVERRLLWCDTARIGLSSDIIIRTHKDRPMNKQEPLLRSNHWRPAPLVHC
jgi:hypothetical protein